MNTLKLLAFLKAYITNIFQVPVKHYLSTDIVLFTHLLRKKIRQGKTYFKGTSILLEKRYTSDFQYLTQMESSSDFCLPNFAPASAFHAIGIEFSSGFHRAIPIKTRCRPDENPMKCKNSAGIAQKMVDYSLAQETHKLDYNATLGSPLLSPCYTQGQLNDCTRPIQQKQAFQQVGESRLTYGVESERSVLSCFKSICKAFVFQVNSLLVSIGLVVQRALKCFLFVADYKRAYRMVLSCVCLRIVFQSCKFSFKALKSIRALALLALMISMFSLSAQTPRKDSGADGLDKIKGLQVGDRLPDKFWSTSYLGLKDGNTAAFNFHQSKGKFILLDFWATWCTVCVKGFPKIDSLHRALKDNVAIVLVNQKGNRDTKESIAAFFERYHSRFPYAMDMPQIFQDTILNQYFQHRSIPHYVLISPKGRVLSLGSIREFNAMIEILDLSFYKNNAKALKERSGK
ncbi:TlpA family protein disulfide reductase [Sphingobacterium siyangense]